MKNLNEQIVRIKTLMGVLTEQWNPCKKCMGKYNGTLSDCSYEAIERFEENYGNSAGGSMGDDYFESTFKTFDTRIINRILKLIGNSTWNSMSEKFKMQLWSFMFNSDSGDTDKYRWLALLYLTADPNINNFDESKTMTIINKPNTPDWKNALNLVTKTTNWDEDKFKKMILGQYNTYGNKEALGNSWNKRPDALDDMYNDCISNKQVNTTQPSSGKKTKLIDHKNNVELLRDTLKKMGILYNPKITTTDNGVKVEYELSGQDKKSLSYIYSPSGELESVLTNVKKTYPNIENISYDINDFKGYIIIIDRNLK